MTESFLRLIFEASITAGIAAAAVMLIRIPLKKAPKRWSYMLWAVVFFRCLCPFSVESTVSLFNAVPKQSAVSEQDTADIEAPKTEQQVNIAQHTADAPAPLPSAGTFYNPYDGYMEPRYADYSGYADFDTVNAEDTENTADTVPAEEYTDIKAEEENTVNIYTVLLIVWIAGTAAMAVYGAVSYIRLMRKIRTAVRTADGVYETDLIPTAFSAGFFPPRVYIPCGLSDTERRLIVTHERVHIRRLDYITKPLAFAALALHWFNPLIWAAFMLMTKDMELSCDEAVLKICGAEEKKDYSRALLRVSMKRSGLAVIPLAFAETGITGRVKNVLRYKKPRAAATLLAGALVIMTCAVLGTNAVKASEDTRVLLEKGTTEFVDENGEVISFAYGEKQAVTDRDSGEASEYTILRFRDEKGKVCRFWGTLKSKGFQSASFSADISDGTQHFGSSGDFGIDCDISEITVNDISVKFRDNFYYIYISMDILADDTLPEKIGSLTWERDTAEVNVYGGDGRYTVNADIKANWEGNEKERYGLLLSGFDGIPVYAAKDLTIAGHLGSGDTDEAYGEKRVLLEKGTTEFKDANGESVFFAYGDTEVLTNGETGETLTTFTLRYKDESGKVHNLRVMNELKGFESVAFSADESGNSIGSAGAVDIDCNVSEITLNDICVKYRDGLYYIYISMDILADDTLPEKIGSFTWYQDSAEVYVYGGDGRYTVNAEIKSVWNGITDSRHYGLALMGFDDIPVYASKNLQILGHIGSDDAETELPKNSEQAEQVTNNRQSKTLYLEKGKTEFMGSGGERIFLSYKEENPMIYAYSPEALKSAEKNFDDDDMVYVGFPDRIGNGGGTQQSDIPALTAETYSVSKSGNSMSTSGSLRGSTYDIMIDSDVSQIAVNDLDIKYDNDKILLCLDLDVWADEWTSDLVKFYEATVPNAPETSSVLTAAPDAEDGRICNIKAEIEVSKGNVGYGLVLSGFDDIPILAEGKAAGKFVDTLTNEEVKQTYLENMKKFQEEAKSSYPAPAFPLSYENIGEYGASNRHILFAVPKGTEVLASADGTVKSAATGFNNGYGNCIEISHVGEMSTFYAYLDDFAVEVGDEVKKGDVIGYSGSSGLTLGDALLFEIRMDGIAENPWNYFYFHNDGYQRTLDEIGKNFESDGIHGIYYDDGVPMIENEQETIEINGKIYYLISTEEQLRAIAAGVYGMDKNFLQNGNIYLSSYEWIPIGTRENPFTGSYNGNGFEITGLTMKNPDADLIGMFGYAENAHIYNITLRDYDIESAGRNAEQYSCAPILPIVTDGTRCYDNYVYLVQSRNDDTE